MQDVGSKTDNILSKFEHIPSARQTTNSTPLIPKICISLQYYKGKALSFKAAIVTSLIDLSALI